MRLDYSWRALRHLQSIHDYIARENPQAADATIQRIRAATKRLEAHPLSGRSSYKDTRILVVPDLPYVVIYRVNADRIKVLSVFHTARNRRF
jgi:addiction module RelE/StbE family toxin